MFTHMFQFLLVSCAFGLAVVAILTHRADRREVVAKADQAWLTAQAFINRRIEYGHYDGRSTQEMKNDLDNKYIELISK